MARPPLELDVSYSAAGSKVGRERLIAEAVDFAVSEVAFPAAEQAALAASGRASSVVVPVAAAPLAFMFNVVGTNGARITDLRLTAADACRIFTEPAIRWDDPSIAAANPGRALPPRAIRPVVRADESGESLAGSR